MNKLKYKKGLFNKVPDGWEDLGVVKPYYNRETRSLMQTIHIICGEKARVGRIYQDGKYQLFRHCRKCECQVDFNQNDE